MPQALRLVAVLAITTLGSGTASAQIDARMLRYPAVSKRQIAFVPRTT